ncbi:ATP-binding cassette domain-containing protein [Nocardia africana]|uniref:ATP-binding cassette domain-containing protein n=1 Tax=Nocardia africana TaxID=134964 RepID=A0ABW6NRQ5_9NOCA
MTDWALRVRELTKHYPRRNHRSRSENTTPAALVAARDITFDLHRGEALGLVGASGSGKSSVLKCIAGLHPATSGHAYLRSLDDGTRDVLTLTPPQRRALHRGHLAIVHQNPADGVRLELTAGANVARPLLAAGARNFTAIRHEVADLLDRVEIPRNRIDDKTGTFSGGMRQRVQLAAAIASKPRILLLDEPTTGLDASAAAAVLDVIADLLTELAVSTLVVSHDFSVIELLCARTLVMKDGIIIENALTDQLLEDPQHPYSQELVAAARG